MKDNVIDIKSELQRALEENIEVRRSEAEIAQECQKTEILLSEERAKVLEAERKGASATNAKNSQGISLAQQERHEKMIKQLMDKESERARIHQEEMDLKCDELNKAQHDCYQVTMNAKLRQHELMTNWKTPTERKCRASNHSKDN